MSSSSAVERWAGGQRACQPASVPLAGGAGDALAGIGEWDAGTGAAQLGER